MARKRNISLVHLLNERTARGDITARQLEREKHTTVELINRLGLYKELQGHEGCVNCLDWNKSGTILASGSDDQTVILWKGCTGTLLTQLSTEHEGNIFSVKFLPEVGDRFIVTGAQDARVCLLDVEKKCSIQSAALHIGRVKRLAVCPDTSGLFWSAAEDGTVMQWDTRERWRTGSANVLINLVKHVGKAEVKCIAVNPTKPELIAVGANDPYLRIFDRRKLSLQRLTEDTPDTLSNWERRNRLAKCGGVGDDTPLGAVQYFVPGHLPRVENKYRSILRPLAVTYLSFSSDGTELVVNMGGEHVYFYDKFSLYEEDPRPNVMKTLAVMQPCDTTAAAAGSSSNGRRPGTIGNLPTVPAPLPPDVEILKLTANAEFEAENYTRSIDLYNTALVRCAHPVLYGNRAAALMKRNYSGDVYAALRDCVAALSLNPDHVKAVLRLAKCLYELARYTEAERCLEIFQTRYPEHTKSPVYRQLEKNLRTAAEERLTKAATAEEVEKDKEKVNFSRQDFLKDTPSTSAARALAEGGEDEAEGGSEAGEEDGMEVVDQGPEPMEDDEVPYRQVPPRKHVVSEQELYWRKMARDYTSRYVGACNTTTDIKEANFFGSNCQFIVSGSDDGKIMIWDRESSNLVKVLVADNSTVNCVQGHPIAPVLASSGIDPVVRLWHPLPEDGREEARTVKDVDKVIKDNQARMSQDPFEYFISNSDSREDEIQCRTS